jgi:plasmid stabilization system protein ParE
VKHLRILPKAEQDIAQAYSWYEDQLPGLGRFFLDEAEAAFQRVLEAPEAFPMVELDIRRILFRRFPFAGYFSVGPERVTIYAVLHQRRDPRTWRRRVGA